MIETGETEEFASDLIEERSRSGFVSVGREDYRFLGFDCSRNDAATVAAIRKMIFDKRPFCWCEFAVEINGQKFCIGTVPGKTLYILHAFYRLHHISGGRPR
jgi:predicted nucleotidyltransferase